MSRYWVYIDDKVAGPYSVDQLIRIRGFSRQTRICMEDGSEAPKAWTSPADIPELSKIFKAVEDVHAIVIPTPRALPRPPHAKPRARAMPSMPYTPPPSDAPAARSKAKSGARWGLWIGLVLTAAALAGGYQLWQRQMRHAQEQERQDAQKLVEDTDLPAKSVYPTFGHYLKQKEIDPRWEFERQPTGLQHVTASWFEPGPQASPTSTVYAFEVNLQAQSVRPLNSRASKLLTEGIGGTKPAPAVPAAAPAKPKTPDFASSMNEWKSAQQSGDFDTVWNSYSTRKVSEMRKGGITRDGFLRLQALTHKLETGIKISVEKTVPESDDTKLVLLKQIQPGRSDMYIKQYWILEDGTWKLDDEQKKTSASQPSEQATDVPAPKPAVSTLPGVSN